MKWTDEPTLLSQTRHHCLLGEDPVALLEVSSDLTKPRNSAKPVPNFRQRGSRRRDSRALAPLGMEDLLPGMATLLRGAATLLPGTAILLPGTAILRSPSLSCYRPSWEIRGLVPLGSK